MKIRLGFVSNSSSSSFVCWGVHQSTLAKKLGVELKDLEHLVYSKKSKVLDYGGQEDEYSPEYSSVYLGLEVETIMREFPELRFSEVEQKVADEINKSFGTDFTTEDIQYTEQGWYNG